MAARIQMQQKQKQQQEQGYKSGLSVGGHYIL